jgi:hypothetical protein
MTIFGAPENGLAVDQRIRAEVQTQRPRIETVVGIIKYLIEIADSKERLIAQLGCEL